MELSRFEKGSERILTYILENSTKNEIFFKIEGIKIRTPKLWHTFIFNVEGRLVLLNDTKVYLPMRGIKCTISLISHPVNTLFSYDGIHY